MKRLLTGCALVLSAAFCAGAAEPQTAGFHELQWHGPIDGQSMAMNYVLFLPHNYSAQNAAGYPLVFFMGGSGNAGAEFNLVYSGSPAEKFKADGRLERTFPGILVVAQCPPRGYRWNQERMARAALLLIDQETRELRVDKNHISVMGYSEGGQGVWWVAQADPSRWAVISPMASKTFSEDFAARLSHVPMWAVVGQDDNYQDGPLGQTTKMVDLMRAAGDRVIFTVLPHINHWCWHFYYTNAQYYEWILDHRRGTAGERFGAAPDPARAPGRYLEEFDTTVDGQAMHISYTVTLPRGYAPLGAPRPLLLSLSELGVIGEYKDGWCLHGPDLELERKHVTDFPFILISPMCPVQLKYWSDPNVEQAIRFGGNTSVIAPESPWNDATLAKALSALVDDVCRKYPVDKHRLYATGVNQGALGIGLLAQTDPGRFAAMAGAITDPKFSPPSTGATPMRIVNTPAENPSACYAQPEFYEWLLEHHSAK